MKNIFKIIEYLPDTQQIVVRYARKNTHKDIDEFVKKELVPGLNISSDYFWKTLEDIVERFSERNRELLNERENLLKKIEEPSS